MILLSFIIPVYNCESLVRRCVESITQQGISDYEIILVNDGSKDASLSVCNALASEYHVIRVFTHDNVGTSTTRNRGLKASTGRYVWFVDADDYIPSGFLQKVWPYILDGQCELLTFNFRHITKGGTREVLNYNVENDVHVIDYLRNSPNMFAATKIYKRETLGRLRFKDGLKNIEDFLFNLQYFYSHHYIHTLPTTGYVYDNTNENSTSVSKTLRNLIKTSQDSMVVHLTIKEDLDSIHDAQVRDAVEEQLHYSVAGYFFSLLRFYNLKYLRKVRRFYKEKGLFPIGPVRKRRAQLFIRLMNVEPIVILLSLYYRRFTKP